MKLITTIIKRPITSFSASWLLVATLALLSNQAYGTIISASINSNLFGNLDQAKTNCPNVNCGPTAATNSLAYLQRKFPSIYDEKLIPDTNNNNMIDEAELIGVANDIGANYMKNCIVCGGTGTYIEDFILGKRDYIESKVPGRTKYGAQISIDWRTDAPDFAPNPPGTHVGTPKPYFVQDMTAATLAFLASEIAKGEDVEVFVGGGGGTAHYLTLTGITFDDVTMLGMLDFIDPSGGGLGMANILGLSNGVIQTSYQLGGQNALLFHAVSESVPEPSVLLFLVSGLIGLFILDKKMGVRRQLS